MNAPDDVPAGLATVANARPGQTHRIRHILHGAGRSVWELRPGTVVRCIAATPETVVLEAEDGFRMTIDRFSAAHLQVEHRYARDASPVLVSRTIRSE